MRLIAAVILSLPLSLAGAAPRGKDLPNNETEKTIYTLGVYFADKTAPFGMDAREVEVFSRGFKDKTLGKPLAADFKAYVRKLDALQRERMTKISSDRKKKDAAQVKKLIAKKKGVMKTKSGLILVKTKKTKGAKPGPSDKIKAHYHGTFLDGKVFDSSVQRGKPYEFSMAGGVIKCWLEAFKHLGVGEKATLYCPSDIAYGDAGRGGIPGGATLRFDVELVEIVK